MRANKDIYHVRRLFDLVAEGDEKAFADVFQLYFEPLYRILLRYTKSPSDAEDIVQQAFVRLWEGRHRMKEIDDPAAWLFTITRNEFRDRHRKLRVSQRYRQYLLEVFEEEAGSPEETMIFKQHEYLLQQAIAGLSDRQREAYLLSREEGLTYEDIAQRMGLGRTTVKEHISRAVKAIKAFLLAHKDELLLGGIIFFRWLSSYFFSCTSDNIVL
jgi:RNA polymerase sigma-70 factor (family 1)